MKKYNIEELIKNLEMFIKPKQAKIKKFENTLN